MSRQDKKEKTDGSSSKDAAQLFSHSSVKDIPDLVVAHIKAALDDRCGLKSARSRTSERLVSEEKHLLRHLVESVVDSAIGAEA